MHKPGAWDIPGGRLEQGEDPFTGLQRETKEETGLDIEIIKPLDIHYFVRDDGQQITLLIFLCSLRSHDVKLSQEHTEYKWVDLKEPIEQFPQWLYKVIENYGQLKYN